MTARTLSPTRPVRGPLLRRFYVGIAIAFAVTVLVGFGPTFYLKPIFGAPPLTALTAVHGILFSSWIALFILQATLVARRRPDLHRQIGSSGVVLAVCMVIIGLLTAMSAAGRGISPPGAPPPLSFFAIPFFAIVSFAVLFGAAIILRGKPEAHKRLMVLATIAMLGAAIARLPFGAASIPPVFFALSDLFIVAGVVYDWRTRKRVHPAYL